MHSFVFEYLCVRMWIKNALAVVHVDENVLAVRAAVCVRARG